MHDLHLTAFFDERRLLRRGHIAATVEAARPVAHYRKHPRLHRLIRATGGHYCGETGAREALDGAARMIRFMDLTGLNPSLAWDSLFPDDACHRAGLEHTEVWVASTGAGPRWLVTTEPYTTAQQPHDWLSANGWAVAERPAWSLWNPPATTLLICSPPRRGYPLDPVLKALDAATPIPHAARGSIGEVHAFA